MLRKASLLISALLFPVTMLYLSPGIVFRGARLGVVSGSYFTFAILLLGSIFAGRIWCGYLCPGGGLGEMACAVKNAPFTRGKLKAVKYVVWGLWLIAIVIVAIFVGGGFHAVDPFLGTEKGISIHSIELFPFYYLVIGLILSLSFLLGRRGFCHSICWMAPFMVVGRAFGTLLRLPAIRLTARRARCTGCKACATACPMSLPVPDLVQAGECEHVDCILCGECVRSCPESALAIEFRRPMTTEKSDAVVDRP